MAKIGDRAILEIIACQLRDAGFARLTLCVSHLGELIEQEFGDGERLGVPIDYCWDRDPLGTAAPLRLVPNWVSPALVMNGDILTALDFDELFTAHQRSRPMMTVAVLRTQIPINYGVLDLDGDDRVLGIREKPRITVCCSSGIYVIDPGVCAYIPVDRRMDMPELVAATIEHGGSVKAHRIFAPWYDIGNASGYRTAQDLLARQHLHPAFTPA